MARNSNFYISSTPLTREAAKMLLFNISSQARGRNAYTIAVLSGDGNEGAADLAVELAKAMSDNRENVLLIECNSNDRRLAGLLGVNAKTGLASVLSKGAELGSAIEPTRLNYVYLLDLESGVGLSDRAISSKRFADLVDVLRDHYDRVLFVAPPVGDPVSNAVCSLADGSVVTVDMARATVDDCRQAANRLARMPKATVLGVCCLNAKTPFDGSYDDYVR